MSYGGHEATFNYIVEGEYGEIPEAPAMKTLPNYIDFNPSIDPGNIKLRGGGTRDLTKIIKGLRKPDLTINYYLPSDDVLHFLKGIITLDSHTLEIIYEKAATLVDLRFLGCRMNRATVECSVEDVIKASVDLMGQDLAAAAAKITDATYTDLGGAVPWSDSYVSRGDADGGNQAVTEEATDWKFTIENNLKRVPVIRSANGNLLKYLQWRQRSITGELTFNFEGYGTYTDIINDTEFSIKLGIGPNWAPKYVLFKYCKWDNVATPTRPEDLVSIKLPFTAREVEFEGVP